MRSDNLQRWLDQVAAGMHDAHAIAALLADDAVFHSPVVHTPQRGKAIVTAYLAAAGKVLGGEDFHYLREFDCGERAVLEFVTGIDGIVINGIDMIEWNGDGLIADFKVMVRPLKAITKLHELMAAELQAMQPSG